MGALRKKDVVLFPFPFTNLRNTKLRPCLVLSEEMGEDILLCQITSQNIALDKHCVILPKYATHDGSLAIDSFVRSNMLFTAYKHDCVKKVCSVNEETYGLVVKKISSLIA